MAQRTGFSDPDRHLSRRNGYYTYKRRVPAKVAALDSRAPTIRIALGTRDLGEARVKRDAHERADDELWASFCADGDRAAALARYNAVVARAAALGFTYRHLSSILAEESASAILSRLGALKDAKPASVEETAILGGIASPRVSLSQALEEFVTVIVADELRGKSPAQYKLWLAERKRAIKNFEAVCGPRSIHDITRKDAILFYEWWQHKIAPARGTDGETVTPTHSPSSGNHDLRVLRVLYRRYFTHKGGDAKEIKNPFDNLSFAEEKVGEDEKKRRPFTTDWIQNVILAPGALAGLNEEARAIVLTLVETGCRPGEVGNLLPERIMLSDAVPHIAIKPSRDPRAPRQIKTKSSIRRVPLVGVALEAMRKFPNGFPRYRDKSNSLSAVLGKFFRENGLFPTDEHVIYSFRHSFEDRMKEGHVDAELRKILMGHAIDRPDYGDKGGMAWRRDSMARIALPFDPAIV
ncbi:integrase [Sinorhizobium meliloti]|nr:integrase [Sinorhizobium meliloti]